jgi:hypothetical protein
MKLDHLTFGQLLKLRDVDTLMRVTKAYHKALRRVWCLRRRDEFSVTAAEQFLPLFAQPWQQVIEWLKGPELRSAVKKAARGMTIPPSCYVSVYRELTVHRFPNRRTREALASMIATHCKCHGVPAVVQGETDLRVYVATDSMGCALLQEKPGLKWSTIELMCYEMNVNTDRVFWWLSEYRDKTGWRVNPALWPVNTPDVSEWVKELVYEPLPASN